MSKLQLLIQILNCKKTHDALVKQLDGLGNLSVDDKKALVTKLDAALKKSKR